MLLKNQVEYVDFGKDFLNGNTINSNLFVSDGLHPNANGYDVLGKDIRKLLQKKNQNYKMRYSKNELWALKDSYKNQLLNDTIPQNGIAGNCWKKMKVNFKKSTHLHLR